MNKKFCPKCGKLETKTTPLVNNFCQSCFAKDNPLLKQYKDLNLVICPACKSYLHQNKWQPAFSQEGKQNLRKIIKDSLPDKLKFAPHTQIDSLEINPNLTKKPVETEVIIHGTINDIPSVESHKFTVKVDSSLCNLCKKRKSSYFEATLQIRPKSEKLLKFIENDLKHNNKIFITKLEEKKFGYDLNVTSKEYLKHVISKVKKKFDIETKVSKTLQGRKEGEDVYRYTLLLRLKE
ncbi:MAG: hypothetical protein CMH63_01365 [Nanoarchaeota archaeon]|jgi:nonsense-mediated mRNA decay protein 3|nr:hypothetical protein [Nanoarchaeota archaeon]|tara:strand:- start:53631 stop:54338 length:708 start_codon:yes stop_codon:yes gene_type:complete